MTRYISIDLHTDSFTACILQEGEAEQIENAAVAEWRSGAFYCNAAA